MAYGDDFTESLPYDLSNPQSSQFTNSSEIYDVAINGLPFFMAIKDETPYRRVTAKYRKDQFDNTKEPGEQSLTGWWLRSQSSFHYGAGIKFFEPAQDDGLRYRFNDSRGVDVWTQGQVTLLHDTYNVTTNVPSNLMGCIIGVKDAITYSTGSALYSIYSDGSTGISYSAPTGATTILSLTNDGTRYFYLNTGKIVSGNLSSSTAGTNIYTLGTTVSSGKIRYVKQRLIAGIGNSLYELNPNEAGPNTALPTAHYTNRSDWTWSAIAEGPQAIYVAGYSKASSSIYKITLDTANANSLGFPSLNIPTVVADLPDGEFVKDLDVYLGTYAVIVTNKGVRVGLVSADTGDINYGPLLVSDANCSRVAFRDRFAYISTKVDGEPGLLKIDITANTSSSSYLFAYAYDLVAANKTGPATTVAFFGESDKAAFGSANGIHAESDTDFVNTGYLKTGFIRYNMLDGKIFKYIFPRIDTTDGGLIVESIDYRNNAYTLATFPQGSAISEANVTFPQGSQEYVGFKFVLTRGVSANQSPVFTGYQIKSLPAIPRQRMIQYPVFCFDFEADALNNQVGYEGYAWKRLYDLENVESLGDTIRVQDFRTGESFIGLIEELDFINSTPSDKRFTGFGGIILITVRSVS